MTEQAARNLFWTIAKELKLPPYWSFRFDRASRRFGQCSYRNHTISLSRPLVLLNDTSKVESTIRHEIAHAIVGPSHGHDDVWRRMAIACGDNGERCYGAEVLTPTAQYVATCPKCGKEYTRHRLPKRGRLSSCIRCSNGYFNPSFLLRFGTNVITESSELIMMNQTTLRAGMVIQYDGGLWRIDHCNQSRARIVPLTKRQIETESFTGDDRGGVSISASACVEVVDNVTEAADRMELAREEAELRKLKLELAAEERKVTMPVAKPTARAATSDVRAVKGQGWVRSSKPVNAFRAGSLAEGVLAFIVANPGMTTAQIVESVGIEGAIAACVSRFTQAGLIIKA